MDMKFIKTGILTGVVISIVSWIVSTVVNMIWPYDVLSLGGMRPISDPVMLLFFLHPWVLGFALSYIYPHVVKKESKGNYIDKGKHFGFMMWIITGVPSAFFVFSSMNYPVGFTINSIVGNLLYMLAAGVTIAWANKEKAKRKRRK